MDFPDCSISPQVVVRRPATNAIHKSHIRRCPLPTMVFNYREDSGGSWERIFSILEQAADKQRAEETHAASNTDKGIPELHPPMS